MKKRKFSEQELQTEEWIRRATDDELTARSILKHRDAPPMPVCFFSQQLAEKYLKAFLVHQNRWYPKIHPLDVLLEHCRNLDADFAKLQEDCLFLTSFYRDTRYPADTPDYDWNECEAAFAAAIRVKEFVQEKLKILTYTAAADRGFGSVGFLIVVGVALAVFAALMLTFVRHPMSPAQQAADGQGVGEYPSPKVVNGNDSRTSDVGQTPTATEPPDANTASSIDTSDWKTYRNEEYGFEVRYPDSWQIPTKGINSSFIALFPPGKSRNPDEEYNGDIFIRSLPNPDNLTLSEFYRAPRQTNWFQESRTQIPLTISGFPAVRFEGTSGMYENTIVSVRFEGRVIQITDLNEAHQLDGIFENIVSSLIPFP